ncbi:unnamed protein product [Spirodela intermedia]|uniref:PPC domain-containing protein n=1 Tax=Spirodela intermedia TaxID=51605 RepID=A0A7I8KDG0_SPIIN|nr:unnamed protein product [Spirodela intermedia]
MRSGGGGGGAVTDYDKGGGGLLASNPECHSDEADSRSGDGGSKGSEERALMNKRRKSSAGPAAPPVAGGGGDGSTVEVPRRPRGRPPGSKNKPKPPVVVTREADDPSSPAAMHPYVLEIAAGEDVVESLSRFSRRRRLGLSVMAGRGVVSDVVLHSSAASPPGAAAPSPPAGLSFRGAFEILSVSATFFPPSTGSVLPAGGGAAGFSVTLAGPHGQIFGGLVAGPLRAAATVTILAATFSSPSYHRLPAEDDVSVSVSVSVNGEPSPAFTPQRHHLQRQQPQRSSSPLPPSSPPAAQNNHVPEPCGLSIFSSHLPSDVIWAPAARSPPY